MKDHSGHDAQTLARIAKARALKAYQERKPIMSRSTPASVPGAPYAPQSRPDADTALAAGLGALAVLIPFYALVALVVLS